MGVYVYLKLKHVETLRQYFRRSGPIPEVTRFSNSIGAYVYMKLKHVCVYVANLHVEYFFFFPVIVTGLLSSSDVRNIR